MAQKVQKSKQWKISLPFCPSAPKSCFWRLPLYQFLMYSCRDVLGTQIHLCYFPCPLFALIIILSFFFNLEKISYRLLPNNAMKNFLSPSFLKSILYSPVCMYRKSPMLVPTAGHLGYFKYFATMNNTQCGLILCSLPFTQVWVYLKDKWLGDDFDRNGQTIFQRSWINLPSL